MNATGMHERGAADCRPAPPPAASAIGSASAAVSRSPATRPDAITLGIVGGGQLAKMTAQAAAQLGSKVVILERQSEFPAGSVAARTIVGDWNDPDSLLELAALADVVTLENEFVETDSLAVLEQNGHTLWPSSATMRLVQDKLVLDSTALRAPAAAMVNLLASSDGPGKPQGLAEALLVAGAHVHLYGKTRSAPGRKMGHVTALGATPDEALAIAQRAAAWIRFD